MTLLSQKGRKRTFSDVGFIFITNNLKRILNLIGKKGFLELYGQLVLCLSVLIQCLQRHFNGNLPSRSHKS